MKMTWIEAARRGNVSELLDHFAEGQKVNAEDENGLTALAVAVQNGQAKAVKELLTMGADPKSGGAPYIAIEANRADLLKILLEYGLNPNGSMRSMGSFIEKAAQPIKGKDKQSCLDVLIKAGADKAKVERAKEAAGLVDGPSPETAVKSNSKSKSNAKATGKKKRKSEEPSDPVEDGPFDQRRGTLRAWDWGTWTALSAFVGGTNGLETLAKAMEKAGTTVQRDVTAAALSGKLARPRGPYLLIVKLKGHDWAVIDAYGIDPWDEAPRKRLSRDAKTRLIWCGHQDTASATFFSLYDNGKRVVRFSTTGLGAHAGETTFASASHDDDWLDQFDDENEALQALVREQDAYVPKIFSFGDEGGTIPDDMLKPANVERIMLAVYDGAGATSEATKSTKVKRKRGSGQR